MSDKDWMLKKMADRFALVLMAYWAKSEDDTFSPFNQSEFWQTPGAFEMRGMPEYQLALEQIREMIRDIHLSHDDHAPGSG